MKLSQISPGTEVIVKRIEGEDLFTQRLQELGLIPGKRIKVLRTSLFQDPLEIEIDNSFYSIRKKDAAKIEVELVK